jgi:hypothetical protein
VDLLQTVLNARDGNAVAELGRSFGLDQGQTAAAVGQLLPALAMGALAKQIAGARAGATPVDPGVLGMLTPLLDSNKDGSVADDVMGMLGKFLR